MSSSETSGTFFGGRSRAGEGSTAMPHGFSFEDRRHAVVTWTLAFGIALALAAPVRAADLDYGVRTSAPFEGVACSQGMPPWPTVWRGHFSGGKSFYDRGVGEIALAWTDQQLCFPSRAHCNRWVQNLRRHFYRPEGYFTCLKLR